MFTNSSNDLAVYQNVIGNFSLDPDHFLNVINASSPAWAFQYGEAASGLMLAGVPFNSTSVLTNMNAVYESNINGTIFNKPFQGDWANTETLPAYMLSTWLFEGEMKNATDYWVSSLSNCNITSLSYVGGTLNVTATGRNGNLVLSRARWSRSYAINGSWITIVIPGDINGDGEVGSVDLALLRGAYSSHCASYHYEVEPASPNWNPNADIDGNGIVGLSDLVILALHYERAPKMSHAKLCRAEWRTNPCTVPYRR